MYLFLFIVNYISYINTEPSPSYNKDTELPDLLNLGAPHRVPHEKGSLEGHTIRTLPAPESWTPDFSKFESYVNAFDDINNSFLETNNRIKRRAKRRHRNGRRRGHSRTQTVAPNSTTEEPRVATGDAGSIGDTRRTNSDKTIEIGRKKKKKTVDSRDTFKPTMPDFETDFVEMPKDLYQAHLRPGVIFRIHMSEAIIKMQYRNCDEDKDESVVEADVEYLRLTRKVISDEITKFEDLIWLVEWFNNRSDLIQEHYCNTRYYTTGIPPTAFTHSEEYMRRLCLFDNVYIDHVPYVIGEDGSLMAAVAPPVLHCDAATCTSVPFIDSLMFEERYSRTNVRTMTRCQASCRAHCRNDADCLTRCTDRCYRVDKY